TKLTHVLNDYIEVARGAQPLFRYNYAPTFDPWESRKPFMHPMQTLRGNTITCYRPHDHVWHKGLQMCMANLSGQNFWGGYSYVRGQGYVKLFNVGRMQHVAWNEITSDGDKFVLQERLTWITQANQDWIAEER